MRELTLTGGHVALVSACDWSRVRLHKWQAQRDNFGRWTAYRAVRDGKRVTYEPLADFIMHKDGVEHLGSELDNRRTSLI